MKVWKKIIGLRGWRWDEGVREKNIGVSVFRGGEVLGDLGCDYVSWLLNFIEGFGIEISNRG